MQVPPPADEKERLLRRQADRHFQSLLRADIARWLAVIALIGLSDLIAVLGLAERVDAVPGLRLGSWLGVLGLWSVLSLWRSTRTCPACGRRASGLGHFFFPPKRCPACGQQFYFEEGRID